MSNAKTLGMIMASLSLSLSFVCVCVGRIDSLLQTVKATFVHAIIILLLSHGIETDTDVPIRGDMCRIELSCLTCRVIGCPILLKDDTWRKPKWTKQVNLTSSGDGDPIMAVMVVVTLDFSLKNPSLGVMDSGIVIVSFSNFSSLCHGKEIETDLFDLACLLTVCAAWISTLA
eukprot:scaffold78062_cov35-Attheya_sp.AAC.1